MRKKKGRFGTVFHNILFIGQFVNFFIAAQGKSKLKQNEFQLFQQGVYQFIFPVNLSGGQFFVTAKDIHL